MTRMERRRRRRRILRIKLATTAAVLALTTASIVALTGGAAETASEPTPQPPTLQAEPVLLVAEHDSTYPPVQMTAKPVQEPEPVEEEDENEVCADHFYRAEGQAADIIDVLVRAGLAGFSDKGNISKALVATLADGELLFEVIDSASAHKVFTGRELIGRFSAAKGVDPDDVTEFIGALEVMDGFSAVSIGREIIVQYAPLGDGRPYQLFKFTIGQHRSDVVAEPRVTRHQLQSNGRDPAEANSFFEALIPYADTASMKPAPDGSISVLPLSIDALMDGTMGLVAAARGFAKTVSQ